MNSNIPKEPYKIILTSVPELERCGNDPRLWALKIKQINSNLFYKILVIILKGKDNIFNSLIMGIDPGYHIGIVAVCDGMVLKANTVFIDNLDKEIANNLLLFPSKKTSIKIGNRPTYLSMRIFNIISRKYKGIKNLSIRIIDEKNSNIKKTNDPPYLNGLTSDERAALEISRRD